MSTLPPPLSVPSGVFEASVSMFAEIPSEELRARISPAGKVVFSVTESVIAEYAGEADLEPGAVSDALSEASQIASAVLSDHLAPFISSIVENADLEGERKEEVRKTLKEKAAHVTEVLITDDLRRRFRLADTSKHERLLQVDWEIVEKTYDSQEKDDVEGGVAIIRLDAARQGTGEAPWIFGLIFGEREVEKQSLMLECDREDLAELINALTTARQKLSESSSSKEK